jgi:photosystem II stability/assembly factor-like uncharacterized protein
MSDDFRTTDDGGRHWEQQSLGTVGVQSFYPVYCSPKGQCIADGVDRLGQEYVLTGSAHASAWVSHPFPTPQMLSLPRQL